MMPYLTQVREKVVRNFKGIAAKSVRNGILKGNQLFGVNRCSFVADFKMQVWTRRAAGSAAVAYNCSGIYKIAWNYATSAEMSIKSFETVVVANDHTIAISPAVLRNTNHAVESRCNAIALVQL